MAWYSADFDKIKCLEFTLQPGKTVFIPAFWWYSIKFNKNTSISCFRYRTYMNNIAISPYIAMYALQIQNVKRNVAKKASIEELNMAPKHVPIVTNTDESVNVEKTTDLSALPQPQIEENTGIPIETI